ncbi:predicted protein [Plenodomus lingam JN3]|uniref:Predicted protein n=1 Tax=Leptosphaeria maculans (strain JN3 / isolate v23.1.3 / race Av1-4-5-6-7-8) TaxID=985895 RepID=E5AEI9_LEPMJ|nr:predicted protein [Plenodomus lingam JN3]CBY01628.1 predicted protein [Plenodomus lingam JN3]
MDNKEEQNMDGSSIVSLLLSCTSSKGSVHGVSGVVLTHHAEASFLPSRPIRESPQHQ